MSEENAGASGASEPGGPEKPQELARRPDATCPRGAFLAWFTVLVAVLSLFAPLATSGIWDPPEREVAELARRIALNLLGGHGLGVEGANNDVPTRSELGRGELPFTSIAAGFRAFGLHEWAGRFPLALWGAVGLAATYLLVRRLSDRRSGLFAVLVLATMPLYFLHARTMLGDIVTMAALALALSGLGLSVFERAGQVSAARYLAVGLGLLGVFCALLSRGVLIGVALPAFSVGVSWLILRASGITPRERFGDALGALLLTLGVVAGVLGGRALYSAPDTAGQFSLWLGSAVNRPHVLPTFDSVLLQLGHALFPWSAVLPVALGAVLREPPVSSLPERQREAALRVLALMLPVTGLLVYGLSAPVVGPQPFGAVSALAIAVALFIRDFERGAKFARAMPMVAVAFAVLLLFDFKNFPEKGLSAFCVGDVHFPESFKPTAERMLELGTLLFCCLFFFLLQERSTHADRRFDREEYGIWPRTLRTLWAGNLQFALLVLEAALIGVCVLGFLSDHVPHAGKFEALGAAPRATALGGAIALPLLVLSPSLLTLVRDAFRTLFDPELGSLFGSGRVARWLAGGLSRAQAALYVCVGFGLLLSLGYYPLLTAQISPKQVFDAYRQEARPGEALGMLGPGAASASYYAGRTVPSFDNATHAFEWLVAANERRWLVIRQSDLGTMNTLYRGHQNPPQNLPVLDARSSEILLVSNQLGGRRNDNPLEQFVLSRAPHPSHALDANFGDKLDVLGWDALDRDGHPVDDVEPGRRYSFVIYYHVVQPVSGSWDTFIHIDGFQRRFNGDHPTLDGKYPFNLWRVGDFIADRYSFELEPNFGAGRYQVYFGLYSGNRRLEVRRGQAAENRLEAGYLEVR
jgi:4-amino-4-deoxy-L-arabinose transferase-like glycosyltransferase